MNSSIFSKLFGGISSETFDAIPLIPFGRWLLPVGAFLLIVGYCMERNKKIEMFSCYRYGSVLNWWKNRFWKGILSGAGKAGFFLVVVFVCDLALGNAMVLKNENLKIGVLWILHMICLNALFLVLDLLYIRHFVPASLLLLEGVTFMLGYRIKWIANFMYGTWGMYLQSSWYETGGFQVEIVFAAELLLVMSGYYAGKIYLKNKTRKNL